MTISRRPRKYSGTRGKSYQLVYGETLDAILATGTPNALAVWMHLSRKPDDWMVIRAEIMRTVRIGRDALQTAVNTLKELGLWDEVPQHDPVTGRWTGYDVVVYDCIKISQNAETAEEAPSEADICGSTPDDGSTGRRVNRATDNPHLLNIDSLPNKEKDSIDLTKVDPEVWQEWTEYRKNIIKKPLNTPLLVRKAAEFLGAYPPHLQKQIINHSMNGGYPGLYAPRVNAYQPDGRRGEVIEEAKRQWEERHGR